jgi:hypothetical protein
MLPAADDNDGRAEYPIIIDTDSEAEVDDDKNMGEGSQLDIEQGNEDDEDDDDTADEDEDYADSESVGGAPAGDTEGGAPDAITSEHAGDDSAKCRNGSHHDPLRDDDGIEDKLRANESNLETLGTVAAATAHASTYDTKKWEKIESMNAITKSPYDASECAEVGEAWFERLKVALTPVAVNGEEEANPELIRRCGDRLAISIFTAHQQIGKTGVLYSPLWAEGKIRDIECGWLPKKQLLVCLHEHRFLKAEERVLQAIVNGLQTSKLVKTAMKAWGLSEAFLNLSVANIFAYKKRKADCYKCELFVARAFAINDILRIDSTIPDESLMKKIKACLSIMSQHVKSNSKKLAKRQQALEERKNMRAKAGAKTTGLEFNNSSDSEDQGPLQATAVGPLREISVTMDGASGGSGSAGNESAVTADSTMQRINRGASVRNSKRERQERQESLLVMVGIVQEQHARLGRTIEFIRSRIQENIDATAVELREDCMNDRELKCRRTISDRKDLTGPSKRSKL